MYDYHNEQGNPIFITNKVTLSFPANTMKSDSKSIKNIKNNLKNLNN